MFQFWRGNHRTPEPLRFGYRSRLYDSYDSQQRNHHELRMEIGGLSQNQAYGNFPTASTLTADMDSTQTTIHVTSTWVAGDVSKAGTLVSAGNDYNGYSGKVFGTGTTFTTSTMVGDIIK